MNNTNYKLNFYLLTQLPLAYIAGVRLKSISNKSSIVGIKFRWINKNPFRSMYFAAQLMAAELSTGILCMNKIQLSGESISMLLVGNKSQYLKKALGKIRFICQEGNSIDELLTLCSKDSKGRLINLTSTGYDSNNEIVSKHTFEWSFKKREN